MKFCKNLQRVVDISDPEWAPYWTNYKMLKVSEAIRRHQSLHWCSPSLGRFRCLCPSDQLSIRSLLHFFFFQKLIKELPSLVPNDEGKGGQNTTSKKGTSQTQDSSSTTASPEVVKTAAAGDQTGEGESSAQPSAAKAARVVARSVSSTSVAVSGPDSPAASATPQQHQHDASTLGKSPGEVAFFKLLHSEFKKASHFFDRATEEFTIREARVREGMEIMKQPNSIMVNEKWSFLAKSIYRLYKDLLLLETFAIMTYCSFSKILKKHDKVTGYETRNAFMENIVNKANFTHYPPVLAMITRCEGLYEEVSSNLLQEGKHGLYEDERTYQAMLVVICAVQAIAQGVSDILSSCCFHRFVYQHDFSTQ